MAERETGHNILYPLRYCRPCHAWTDARIDGEAPETTLCRFCGSDLSGEPHQFSMHARGLIYASKSTPEWNEHARALGATWLGRG